MPLNPLDPQPDHMTQAIIDELTAAGIGLVQSNGVFKSDDPVRAVSIIASHDMLAEEKALKATAINAEAARRIALLFGGDALADDREKKMLRRSVQLTWKKANGGVLTADEQSEADSLLATAAKVEAIRDASNLVQSDLAALADIPSVVAFDVAGSARWPA